MVDVPKKQRKIFAANPANKKLLFHENTNQLFLFNRLAQAGFQEA